MEDLITQLKGALQSVKDAKPRTSHLGLVESFLGGAIERLECHVKETAPAQAAAPTQQTTAQ